MSERARFENRSAGGAGPVIIVDGLAWGAPNAPAAVMQKFAAYASRQSLIAYCLWNDRNACVTDAQMRREFGRVATTEELRATVRSMIEGSA